MYIYDINVTHPYESAYYCNKIMRRYKVSICYGYVGCVFPTRGSNRWDRSYGGHCVALLTGVASV